MDFKVLLNFFFTVNTPEDYDEISGRGGTNADLQIDNGHGALCHQACLLLFLQHTHTLLI